MPAELSMHVVGAAHPNKDGGNRLFEILLCQPGEPVTLVPEPKNPADPNAIMVISARGIQIGYLAAERAIWIGGRLRLGAIVEAVFQERTTDGAAIRVNLEGRAPTLPVKGVSSDLGTPPAARSHRPAPPGADPDIGFYPDEEWPDD